MPGGLAVVEVTGGGKGRAQRMKGEGMLVSCPRPTLTACSGRKRVRRQAAGGRRGMDVVDVVGTVVHGQEAPTRRTPTC